MTATAKPRQEPENERNELGRRRSVFTALLCRLGNTAMALNIIFDGPPGSDAGRFVEVENDFGESIKAGEWSENGDGTWTLKIDEIPAAAKRHRHVAGPDGDIDTCRECGKDFRSLIHLRVGESA